MLFRDLFHSSIILSLAVTHEKLKKALSSGQMLIFLQSLARVVQTAFRASACEAYCR